MTETKPKFQRSVKNDDGGVTCLQAVTLAGIHLAPGDHVTKEFWESKVPALNRASLIATGTCSTDPDEVTEGESAVHAQHRAALDEAVTVRELLAQIQTDKAAAEQEVTDLEKKHRASALSDYRTTRGKA